MILILDNGDKYKVTNKNKKQQILNIFSNSIIDNFNVNARLSKDQFYLLKTLSLQLGLKYKYLFEKLVNDFNVDISDEEILKIKNDYSYNKKDLVRVFENVNQQVYCKAMLIRDIFNLDSVHDVLGFLLDVY